MKGKAMELCHLGEFGLIGRIRLKAARRWSQVLLGIGGDAAAFRPTAGTVLLATTDLLVEGIHFFREIPGFRLLGRKCLAVNVSDIAAMGGTPRLALVSLAVSSRERVEDIDALYQGLEEEAERHGVTIAGGDTSLSPGPLFVNVALLGEAGEGKWVQRSGAKLGDVIMVTGHLGASAAGLEAIRSARGQEEEIGAKQVRQWRRFKEMETSRLEAVERAIDRHFLPLPRVVEGRWLAVQGWAHAMIDLSDGLASDLAHLCRESGLGARIYEDKLPISPWARVVAEELGKDALALALAGGEDYELLFTTSRAGEVEQAFIREGLAEVTAIGEMVAEAEGISLVRKDRTLVPLKGGFDHFRVAKEQG